MLENIDFLNFVNLNEEEKDMVLSWRNNTNIKKWMFSKDDISPKNHYLFIESLKTSKEKKYFLIKHNEQYIGVIDFVDITLTECNMGVYSNPTLKGKGGILMEAIIHYAFNILKVKKIISEVFEDNLKGQALYKKYSFKVQRKRRVNNENIIVMELSNENR